MAKYSKFNIIYLLQKWMDSVAGQTFMNYAYSWGASIVILGTLFKLTHLPGANAMLFIGFQIGCLIQTVDKSYIDIIRLQLLQLPVHRPFDLIEIRRPAVFSCRIVCAKMYLQHCILSSTL